MILKWQPCHSCKPFVNFPVCFGNQFPWVTFFNLCFPVGSQPSNVLLSMGRPTQRQSYRMAWSAATPTMEPWVSRSRGSCSLTAPSTPGMHLGSPWISLLMLLRSLLMVGRHSSWPINLSPTGQNGRLFLDDIFICNFVNDNFCILIKISVKFVPKCSVDNNPALV